MKGVSEGRTIGGELLRWRRPPPGTIGAGGLNCRGGLRTVGFLADRSVSSLASCQKRMSELRDDLHCVPGFLARILRG